MAFYKLLSGLCRVPQVSNFRLGKPAFFDRFTGPALILLAAAVATAPQLLRGNSCGHDFDFHLVSWFDAQSSWRQGILYPHWTPSANFGAGEPRFVFYPPLTWMLGAALGFVLPWPLVPVAMTFLLLAATGLATRALARQALSAAAATLAGCAAIFSGYTLFTAYERSAFGELTGGFWIPLALLLLLRDRNPARSPLRRAPLRRVLIRRVLDGSTAPLALVVAGAWLSNAPLGVMVCYLLAAVALTAALLWKSWTPVVRVLIAAALGMGLAAVFLVPAAVEQSWADLKQAASDPGERIESSWLFARHADPSLAFHDKVLSSASIVAVAMIGVALAGLLISWRRGRLVLINLRPTHIDENSNVGCPRSGFSDLGKHEPEFVCSSLVVNPPKRLMAPNWWIPLALIPFAVLFLQLPISLPVWNLLPKLRFLQFPWRWLVVLEAPMAVFFAAAVWPSEPEPESAAHKPIRSSMILRRIAVGAACAAVFLSVTATAGLIFFQPCDEEDAVAPMVARYNSGLGVEGTDEYAPPGADNSMVALGLPGACLVTDPSIELGKNSTDADAVPVWQAGQGSCDQTFTASPQRVKDHAEHFEIEAHTGQAGYLILRLRSYPAWRVRVNGRPIAALVHRDDGLMAVPVPQGAVQLTVDWTATRDEIAGRWLSGLVFALLASLGWLERKLLDSSSKAARKLSPPHLS